ncbi:MAG: FeoB-associated Cys-rich membrane protein [Desulfosarcinaceae bacterium]|nr:FeoB-associated Cys-rich membrane protein [Desulfosarcinaceae bacterium]
METILIAIIVALAAAYLICRFYRGFKAAAAQTSACAGGCGCSACDITNTCSNEAPERSG